MWEWVWTCLEKLGDLPARLDTYIVGLLGFLGVIWTLNHNAKLAHDTREKEKAHRREVITSSLITELKIIIEQIDYCKTLSTGNVRCRFPIHRENVIFEALSENLGLLSTTQAMSVMMSYSFHREFYTRLFTILAKKPDNRYFVMIEGDQLQPIDALLNELKTRVNTALDNLQSG